MESWLKAWREGILPGLSLTYLEVLKEALETNSPLLIQGATTQPPPLQCVQDWSVEGACAISYMGWKGGELQTVAEVEEFFARMCYDTDTRLNEPAGCRWFLNWWDSEPRKLVFRELLEEVKLELDKRTQTCEQSNLEEADSSV